MLVPRSRIFASRKNDARYPTTRTATGPRRVNPSESLSEVVAATSATIAMASRTQVATGTPPKQFEQLFQIIAALEPPQRPVSAEDGRRLANRAGGAPRTTRRLRLSPRSAS